jgi:hypothetical protein
MKGQSIQRAIVRALGHLLCLIDSLPNCDCAACDDARAMQHTLTLYRACLECQLSPRGHRHVSGRTPFFLFTEEPCKVP